jgi:shikimate kinase
MHEHGTLVYHKASVDDIIHRVGEGSTRPVFMRLDTGKEGVEKLLKERERYYNEADFIVLNWT